MDERIIQNTGDGKSTALRLEVIEIAIAASAEPRRPSTASRRTATRRTVFRSRSVRQIKARRHANRQLPRNGNGDGIRALRRIRTTAMTMTATAATATARTVSRPVLRSRSTVLRSRSTVLRGYVPPAAVPVIRGITRITHISFSSDVIENLSHTLLYAKGKRKVSVWIGKIAAPDGLQ